MAHIYMCNEPAHPVHSTPKLKTKIKVDLKNLCIHHVAREKLRECAKAEPNGVKC